MRTIDVNDVQVLETLGYDIQENVFSTLQGVRFEWNIQNLDLLESIPIKESSIKSTEIRKKIESSNFQSDILIIKGLRKGQSKVSIKIREKGYDVNIVL